MSSLRRIDLYTAVFTSSAFVSSGLSIGYEASDFVELQDGFEVPTSTDFVANVGALYGCVIE